MVKSALFYKAKSDFDSVNTMVDEIAGGFAAQGWATHVVDLLHPDHIDQILRRIEAGQVDLFVSLNGFGIPAAGMGAGFYERTAADVLVYFVDHPIYHFPTIRAPLPRLRVTFPTAHQVDFCRAWVRHDIPLRHLPHGGTPAAPGAARAWSDRDVGVLVPSSLMCEAETERAAWAESYGPQVATRLNAAIEHHEAAPHRPFHEAVLAALDEKDPPVERLHPYFVVADRYLRSRAKQRVVDALIRRHVPVTVCGPGWPDLAGAACQYATLPVAEVFRLMGRARIVLNLLPPYYESHERPLQAALHGAVGAGSPSPWLADALGGAALELPSDAEAAAEAVAAALAAPGLAERAAQGRMAAAAGHTWAHRAGALIRFAQA